MASAAPTRLAIDMQVWALGADLLRAAAVGDVARLREALVAWARVSEEFDEPASVGSVCTPHHGYTALIAAARNKYGNTALIWAAMNNAKECVALLLLAVDGIDVNVQNKFGGTALIHAVFQNHKECVVLLLAADGVDVNVKNEDGDTALIVAADKGHKGCVAPLLAANGVDVNVQNDTDGNTALHVAAGAGHADVCTLLLTACAAVDALASHGKTALHKAALYGHAAAAAALLRGGASLRLRVEDVWGSTAVQLAAAGDHDTCVEVLQCEARWRTRRALALVREQRRVARDHWKWR